MANEKMMFMANEKNVFFTVLNCISLNILKNAVRSLLSAGDPFFITVIHTTYLSHLLQTFMELLLVLNSIVFKHILFTRSNV